MDNKDFDANFKQMQLETMKNKKVRKPDSKTEVLPVTGSDTESILSLIVQTGEELLMQGRILYPDSADGLQAFKSRTQEYFKFLYDQNKTADDLGEARLLPSVESWALYLRISRVMILQYEKRGGEWLSYIHWVKNAITAVKLQLAENHKLQPLLFLFDTMNNAPMYKNTNQIEVVALPDEHYQKKESPENIASRYRALLADSESKQDIETAENTFI